jgi:DNA-directed RNA polymerase subunit beta'
MRTFHVGGTASTIAEENRVAKHYPLLVREVHGTSVPLDNGQQLFTRKGFLKVARILSEIETKKGDDIKPEDGDKVIKGETVLVRKSKDVPAEENAFIVIRKDRILLVAQDEKVEIRNGSTVLIAEGHLSEADESLAIFDPFSEPIIAELNGKVKFEDIIPGTTLREEINEDTGNIEKKITDTSADTLQPRISIVDEDGVSLQDYYVPENSYLNIEDGTSVKAGQTLAKMLKESQKTQDITGGLPRVGELFEARRPKDSAILSRIGGIVEFEGISKGKRIITVNDPFGNQLKHQVPMGRHLLVRNGDPVDVAEPLCDGPKDPHDVLEIQGENALQQFLVDEVQEVYRMQGVHINDKHIGVIIRQMMRKVEIIDVGDTNFIFGQQVDKYQFRTQNDKVIREGGQPSMAKPLLLGITRASLNIDSWISAASFQETTRVLTNAAIAGDVDQLRGLKENVVIGHIIPAGTGMRKYRDLKLFTKDTEDLDAHVANILEQRRREAELLGGEDGAEPVAADQSRKAGSGQ